MISWSGCNLRVLWLAPPNAAMYASHTVILCKARAYIKVDGKKTERMNFNENFISFVKLFINISISNFLCYFQNVIILIECKFFEYVR